MLHGALLDRIEVRSIYSADNDIHFISLVASDLNIGVNSFTDYVHPISWQDGALAAGSYGQPQGTAGVEPRTRLQVSFQILAH